MLAIAGYYDGANVQFLEQVHINKNQRIIVTVMDEYIENNTPNLKINSNRKKMAFERLEAWRKKNEDFSERILIGNVRYGKG